MVDSSDLHGNAPKKTLRKAHAVKRSRALRTGVAGVAVASTLAMMLPSVVASALQPTQKDIVNASSATRKMGKGRPDQDELNMQRWGAGVINKNVQTQKFVELARKAIEEEALRAASLRELAKSGESADSHNAGEVDASGAGKRNDLGLRGSAAGKSALLGAGFSGSDLTGLREGEHASAEGASVEHTSADDTASRDSSVSVHSRRSAKDAGDKIVQRTQEVQKPATEKSSSQIKDKIQGSAVQQTQSKSVTSAVNVPANTSVTAPASAAASVTAPAAEPTKPVTVPAAPVNVADNHVAQPVAPVVPAASAKPAASASVPAAAPASKSEVSKPAAANQPEVKPAAKTPAEPQSAQPSNSAQPSQQTQATQPVAKTEPANPQSSQQTQTQPVAAKPTEVKPDAQPAEEKQSQATQPEAANAGGVKPAEVKPGENTQPAQPAKAQPANTQPGNAESSKPATEQNTNAQSSSTHAENTNTASDASTPKVRKPRSADGGDSASDGSSVAPANNAPSTPNAAPANNAPADPTAAPAGNASVPAASAASAGAGAGTAAKPSAGGNGNAQGQSAGNAQGSQGNAQGATTGVTGEDKSATPSTPTSNAGTPGAGTTTTNTATDPNSQVIKPNTDNPTADSTGKANKQVQTDKKPKATYNLKIRYTIGGAANKQLVQPYELTIDEDFLNNLGKNEKYEYIELPKAAGYRPSVYHSGDYQYYVKKVEGNNSKFVIDDGTDADAVRYLRLSKKLITDYAVKERPAVGGNNGAQAPQASSSQATTNPQSSSSTQPKAEDGIQYYGELNINYAPKTAKYYVRHLVQNLKDKDTFDEAPNIGKPIVVEHKTKDKNGKVTTTKELIHVTEITGTVGSNVTAVSTYIPGYEPEHNLISSPLSDSEDEKDKLVLNLRYYRKAYEVTYDSAGGTDVTAQKVYYGQKVPEVPEPTYRGHHFLGWEIVQPGDNTNLSGDNNNRSSASNRSVTNEAHNYIMPDHDVKFRAVWEANNTTSYRVNVWVQKADLVDKEHPNSLANYDFVGLVERKNVQTDSKVALDKMNDAGVVDDASKLNGASETDYVKNPELGLTKEELQGKDSKHETGLIAKFNWMNDTHVTDLDGYDTTNPGAESNYLKDSSGKYVTGPIDAKTPNWDNRVYKDIFTRYFHVNKDLTKKLNDEQHDFVPGRPDLGKRSKSQLCANDLNNTLNLVYDRNTYELIFAKPAGVDNGDNAAIKRKDENGKTTIYCYAGGGGCSDKYVGKDKDEHGTEINHKGYRVNVRYGQKLTDIWPDVNELHFSKDGEGSLGWQLGFAGVVKYRDTPPYRFTKEEFADPRWRAAFKKNPKDKVIPKISDDPEHNPQVTHELKDNQRLLTADKSNQSQPIQVIIRKQSIASAKKGGDISEDDYELSTDSYSKDDTPSGDYDYPAPSIAGFNPADGYNTARVGGALDPDDFEGKLEEWYNESHGHGEWDDLSEDEQKAFAKEYHLAFRKYRGVPVDEQENYESDDATEFNDNKPLEFRYDRQKYAVQFYNADGKAITKDNVAATEELPFEYSLTKRGNDKLTDDDDKELYGNDTSYDASVTKDDADDTSKQFDGKYTFTLNGTKYSIVRPDNLPKDYVFKGWALDQAGTRFINGEDKDITVPVNGIKLYAAWGKPEGIKHTVTLDYHMPEIDGNGKEKSGTNVVTKQQFDHYYVIKENKDIKVPTRKGYDFYGWEITKNGTTLPYAFGNKVVEDITLKAVWIEDTRYNGTFKHIFLKPGYTFDDYKNATDKSAKAAMVDHVSTQTVSGLREHLRYNAEAVYSDETHFPDKQFTSFEASSDENNNTGEFIYQTYNTRKYKVRYVTIGEDGKEKDLLPESEVSSVNRKYDVAFYKPIEGFMPETTQQNIEYATDEDGKQIGEKTYTFRYKDVRVLKRKYIAEKPNAEKPNAEKPPYRPDHYTRYVFKVADGQGSMGSVVDWQGNNVADGSALVYDAIKGTKAYQMPLPTFKAKPGFEFAGWTSQIGSYGADPTKLEYATGLTRLPIRSEEQNSPEVIYTANFKLKAPVAAAPQVLTPTEQISTTSGESAKRLITNADEYPEGATFSFAPGEKFDSTPGLHKIKVQVKLGGEKPAEAEVLYRVLPDLVYASDWDKFSKSDYGINNAKDYVPITFTGKNDEGTIIGHDTTGTTPSTGGTTTLTAYVYKGKDVRIRVPQAFGKDHSRDKYHYVFKGWTTKVVEPTVENPNPEQKFDINSSDRYADANLQNGVTYHAVYKKIDYFSNSSDGGEVPKDAVVAIFKPAPGRLWNDGTSGPKVFYVKKGTDISKVPYSSTDPTNALVRLKENLTNATGTWKRSSMLNDGKKVTEVKDVADVTGDWKDGWKVNESFQEFVADQEPLSTPEVESNTLLAIRGDKTTLPEPKDYIANYSVFDGDNKNQNVESVTVEYASTAPTVDKAGVYTVPLIVSVKYKDVEKPVPYKTVGKLKVMHDLIYGENVKDLGANPTKDDQSEHDKIASEYKKVNFITNNSYGTMAKGSRTLFYAHTNKTSGVKAPQAIGKDYDADGYHYEFVGWKKLDSFTKDNSSAETLTTDNVKPNEILQSSSILKNAYEADTTYQAVYNRVKNVIDASQQDEIPDGYVATIFLPGFGRTWADGSYKPKLLYIRHGKDKEDNIKFAKKVASDTAATLSGFTKWQMYNARGDKSNILLHDNWDISKPRIFVAEQNGVDDVKIPETVIGVGESIPNVNKLIHNTDPRVSVSVDENAKVDVSKPGISTIMVNVTKPTDEKDKNTGKQKTVTTKLPVRVYVLPKVIANNDLPAEGTAAAKFIEKNYTKVTYVAGDGGSLQKSPLENAGNEPVSVYWVRNDANGFLMQVPDVLANKGYVFKNWTSITTETPAVPADKRKATEEEREALARLAKIDGMHYVAKLISDSRNSTLAALQNLLNEAQKQHAAQVYNAKREELAKIAESKGNTDLASNIRKSNDSLQNIKNNMLTQEGIDVDEIVEHNREKALLAKIAKEAGNETLAEEISKSNDSLDDLSKKLEKAGIDLAEYDKLTFDKKKEALAQFADINGLHYVASIIRASHESSLEAFKNLIKSAKPDVKIPAYKVNEEDYASEEQRELLIQIAEGKERPDIAAKIRLLHSSTLQDLKKLFKDAGVDLYAIPDAKPKKEITITANFEKTKPITANFEKMAPMKFKFSGSVREGVFTNFSLQAVSQLLTKGLTSVNGISADCNGTACTISGTPKIVNGKPKVELKFTTTDEYGREAEVTMEIDVIPENKPAPTPEPAPEPAPEPQPTPTPEPTPEEDETPDWDFDIDLDDEQTPDQGSCVNPEPSECPLPGANALPEDSVTTPDSEAKPELEAKPEPKLANTGSDTTAAMAAAAWSAALAALGISITKTGKHHRKRRSKES